MNIKGEIPKVIIGLGDPTMPSQQMISHGKEGINKETSN